MTLSLSRPLVILSATALLGGLAAPSVLAQPGPEEHGPELVRSTVAGVEVVTEGGQYAGLVAPRAGGPGIVQTTQLDDTTLLTPTDATGVPTETVPVGESADAPLVDETAGVTLLSQPTTSQRTMMALPDYVESPDYCRDPAFRNPTVPGPGKTAVTIDALDRAGEPAGGGFTLMDYHCEPYEAGGFIAFGITPGEPRTFYVRPGTYSLLGYATTLDASGRLAEEVTFGGDPEFSVAADEPAQITVDARDGEPFEIDTPQASTPSIVVLGWERGVEDGAPLMQTTVLFPQASSTRRISVIPSEPVTDGVFSFFPWVRTSEPWASVRVIGGGQPADLPIRLLNPVNPTPVEGTVPVRVGLEGLAPGDVPLLTDGPELAAQIAAAEAGGAPAVLIGPAQEGLTEPWVGAQVPLLTLHSSDAADLADRIERMGGVGQLQLDVDAQSGYAYDLIDELDTIDPVPFGTLGADDLTTVHQTFHTDGVAGQAFEARGPREPCRCLLTPIYDLIRPGSTRVDHVINNDSTWEQTVIHGAAVQARTAPAAYDETTDSERHWFGGVLGAGAMAGTEPTDPKAPATTFDGRLKLRLGAMDGEGHEIAGPFFRSGSITRDGVVVAPTFGGNVYLDAPTDPAQWQVELTTTHSARYWQGSLTVKSVWEFVAGASTAAEPTALPLLEARTSFPVDASSERVVSGMLEITPWRVDGEQPSEVTVQAELSRDGGDTWTPQPGHVSRGTWRALPPRGSGPVDLRFTVRDGDGSQLTRTVRGAWVD